MGVTFSFFPACIIAPSNCIYRTPSLQQSVFHICRASGAMATKQEIGCKSNKSYPIFQTFPRKSAFLLDKCNYAPYIMQ